MARTAHAFDERHNGGNMNTTTTLKTSSDDERHAALDGDDQKPSSAEVLICYDSQFAVQSAIQKKRQEMNKRHLILSGRFLLSIIFLLSAIGKIFDWSGNVQQMAEKGIPLIPLSLAAALAIELAGALSLLSGLYVRWGAWLLFLYLIPTTLLMHNFWAYTGAEQQIQLVHFLKNLAIMGGLVLAAAEPIQAVVGVIDETAEAEDERPRVRAAGGVR